MNKKGFSLVEIMVAAGMMSLLALGGMKLMKNQTKSSKTIAQGFEETAILNEIRTLLTDAKSCAETFSGLNMLKLKKLQNLQVEDQIFQISLSQGQIRDMEIKDLKF